MDFTPYLSWVDVPDPAFPPAGARMISAGDLLRYENALNAAKNELALLNGQGQQGYKISEVAGRTITVWDYLNNREQMIYGDTGVRSLPVPNVAPLNGVGTITISRTGNEVTMVLDGVEYIGTDNRGYLTEAGFIPAGFRPGYLENPTGIVLNNNANATYPISVLQSSRLRRMGPPLVGVEPGLGVNAFRGTLKWRTTEPWPTTLPGTPA